MEELFLALVPQGRQEHSAARVVRRVVAHRENETGQVLADKVLQAELSFEELVQMRLHGALGQPRLDVLYVDQHLRLEELSDQLVHVDEGHPLGLAQELLVELERLLARSCVGVCAPRAGRPVL